MTEVSNKLTKIKTILSVVLMGAIGSGVWDVFLKEFLISTGGYFVKLMTAIYSGYIDRLYENVGGQTIDIQDFPAVVMILLFILSPFIGFMYAKKEFKQIDEKYESRENETAGLVEAEGDDEFSRTEEAILWAFSKHRNKSIFVLVLPLTLSSIAMTDNAIVATNNRGAIINMERNLEIIRPYISDRDFYRLQSDFRLVDSRDKYQNLLNAVKKHADINSVKLPEVNLYGIE